MGRRRVSRWVGVLAAGAAFALTAALILWALSNADQRTDVLVIIEPVAAGEPVTDAAIGTTRIAADDGYGRIYVASQRSDVAGAIAVTDLAPGDVLGPALLTSKPVAAVGEQLVGVVLRAGRYPTELKAGDSGTAVSIDNANTAPVTPVPVRIASVTISETLEASVTMAVDSEHASTVGVWAGRDQMVLVVTPIGSEP